MSRLRIESNKTGDSDESRFTVVDNSGYLAAQLGVDNVTTDARDAVYTVNGGDERTSKTNTVNLGSGVNVTFKQATDEAVRIAPGRNSDAAKQAVEKMVSDFNKLRDEAAKMAQSDPKAAKLVSQLKGVATNYSRSLSNVGINVASDGALSIDTEKLSEAADNGKLEQFFRQGSGVNYGFASQLSKVADSVTRNPSSYISSPQYRNSVTENFGYGSGGNLITYDFLSSGLMYDFSF
jgi:flagellar hook-associated protein 2